MKCPDCEADIPDPENEGEITSCPNCGLEITKLSDGSLVQFVLEGEDWGE